MAGCGAQLCDRLLFAGEQRRQRLVREAAVRAPLLLDVDVLRERPDLLPTWYLVFITLFFGGSFGTINLINGILLPAQVEQLVGEQAKSVALGTCAFLGTATQLCQPVIGALSDMSGVRRPWVMFGQLASALGCVGMLLARSMWELTASYVVMMLGASVAWGGILCLVPQYVPRCQHGAASGWVGLMSCAGTLVGAGVGFGTGASWWSADSAYYGCAAVNVVIAVTGCISLSGTPTLSAIALKSEATAAETLANFFSSFRDKSFASLVLVIIISSWGPMFTSTYQEYYLRDLIGPTGGYVLNGWQITTKSESAASLFAVVFNFSTLLVVLPAGLATDSIGGKTVMAVGFALGAVVLAGFAAVQHFTPVIVLASAFGVSWGTISGAQTAVFAAALPSTRDSARDMNMFITAPVIAQLVATYGGGHMLSWLGQTFHEVPYGTATPTKAYGVLWLSGTLCFMLAVVPLRWVKATAAPTEVERGNNDVSVSELPS